MVDELRAAGLFTYLVETDTYRTAQDVQDILVKTHADRHGEDRHHQASWWADPSIRGRCSPAFEARRTMPA